jgi:hypothetical protein
MAIMPSPTEGMVTGIQNDFRPPTFQGLRPINMRIALSAWWHWVGATIITHKTSALKSLHERLAAGELIDFAHRGWRLGAQRRLPPRISA